MRIVIDTPDRQQAHDELDELRDSIDSLTGTNEADGLADWQRAFSDAFDDMDGVDFTSPDSDPEDWKEIEERIECIKNRNDSIRSRKRKVGDLAARIQEKFGSDWRNSPDYWRTLRSAMAWFDFTKADSDLWKRNGDGVYEPVAHETWGNNAKVNIRVREAQRLKSVTATEDMRTYALETVNRERRRRTAVGDSDRLRTSPESDRPIDMRNLIMQILDSGHGLAVAPEDTMKKEIGLPPSLSLLISYDLARPIKQHLNNERLNSLSDAEIIRAALWAACAHPDQCEDGCSRETADYVAGAQAYLGISSPSPKDLLYAQQQSKRKVFGWHYYDDDYDNIDVTRIPAHKIYVRRVLAMLVLVGRGREESVSEQTARKRAPIFAQALDKSLACIISHGNLDEGITRAVEEIAEFDRRDAGRKQQSLARKDIVPELKERTFGPIAPPQATTPGETQEKSTDYSKKTVVTGIDKPSLLRRITRRLLNTIRQD